MSLIRNFIPNFIQALPTSVAALVSCVVPLCITRENVMVIDGTSKKEFKFWKFTSPVTDDVSYFNRIVYNEIQDRYPIRQYDGEYVYPPDLEISRTVYGLPCLNNTERFIVPYGAIDGKEPEHGDGGLMRAFENDVFFFNRLRRYHD